MSSGEPAGVNVVRKLLALTALSAMVTSGAALASAPAPATLVPAAAGAAAVEIGPEIDTSTTRFLKDDASCGGKGFTKVVVPLSTRNSMCLHNAADSFPSTAEALKQAHPAAAAKGPATAPVTCYGDGTTGPRVQMIYGYHDGIPNRSKVVVDQIRRQFAPRINAVMKNQSAGRDLGMRFAFTKGCKAIDVKVIKFPERVQFATDPRDPIGQITRMAQVLDAMGYNRGDRKYHVLWDGWNVGACGIGELVTLDPVSSLPSAVTNQGLPTLGARTDAGVGRLPVVSSYSLTFNHAGGPKGPTCFTGRGLSTVSTQVHEIFHTLGAVQLDSPNADTGHCKDAPSVMCSGGAEGYGLGVQIKACARVLVETLDCGMNDYWSPNPIATEYLGTHYNVARSPFFGPQPQDNLVASPV